LIPHRLIPDQQVHMVGKKHVAVIFYNRGKSLRYIKSYFAWRRNGVAVHEACVCGDDA
jgi:hypothetical protein